MKNISDNKYYLKSIKETAEILNTNISRGLSEREAELRLKKFGENLIKQGKKRGAIYKFFSQFKDLMIIILLISAFISFALSFYNGEKNSDAFIILSIPNANPTAGTLGPSILSTRLLYLPPPPSILSESPTFASTSNTVSV